jgi:hypothetical protein
VTRPTRFREPSPPKARLLLYEQLLVHRNSASFLGRTLGRLLRRSRPISVSFYSSLAYGCKLKCGCAGKTVVNRALSPLPAPVSNRVQPARALILGPQTEPWRLFCACQDWWYRAIFPPRVGVSPQCPQPAWVPGRVIGLPSQVSLVTPMRASVGVSLPGRTEVSA